MANEAQYQLHAGYRIADRFELTCPYSETLRSYGIEAWRAKDSVLSRELRALVIPSDHPHQARTIDTARKTGLFEDPHATAVLYVSDTDEARAIFTEFPLGTSLSSYLSGEPLPEPLVTAIIGEAATAINHARHQGLRHLQLSAQHFYISDSGELTLDGIAIFAALAGVNTDRLSEELDRDEARGLIVLYAALLEGKDFPADPHEHQGFIERAAAREDLPDRVRDVFSSELGNAGAASAADVLRRIVPWGDIPMDLLPESEAVDGMENFLAIDNSLTDNTYSSMHNDLHDKNSNTEDSDGERDSNPDESAGSLTDTAAILASDAAFTNENAITNEEDPQSHKVYTALETDYTDDIDSDDDSFNAILYGSYDDSHEDTREVQHSTQDSVDAPQKDGSLSDSGLSDNNQPELEEAQRSEENDKPRRKAKRTAAVNHPTAVSAAATSPSSNAENQPPTSSQSMFYSEPVIGSGGKSLTVSTLVMAIFALGVLIALIAGVFKLLSPLDPVDVDALNAERNKAEQAAQDQENAAAQESHKDSATGESHQPAKVPSIANVSFIYANPDLPEIPDAAYLFEDAAHAGDGNPETEFRSWYFTNPILNEIDQFGLLIELDEETEISQVTLNTGGEGGTVQWRTATAEDPTHGDVLSEQSVSATTKLTVDTPVTTKYLALWVTNMPKDKQSGENLLRITDIALS